MLFVSSETASSNPRFNEVRFAGGGWGGMGCCFLVYPYITLLSAESRLSQIWTFSRVYQISLDGFVTRPCTLSICCPGTVKTLKCFTISTKNMLDSNSPKFEPKQRRLPHPNGSNPKLGIFRAFSGLNLSGLNL